MRYDTPRSALSIYRSVVPHSLKFRCFQVDDGRLGLLVPQWLEKILQVDDRLGNTVTGTGTDMANFIATGTAISNSALLHDGEIVYSCAQKLNDLRTC